MARAVEFRISSLDILHQTFEERRQDPGLILLGCTFDLTLVVFLRSPGKIQNAIRLPQDVLTQLFPFLDNQKHGDAKGFQMRIPKDPAILLRDDDSSCFRQIAVFQTYTLPSFDLTYHAPGFVAVRDFQSRLHPSILLSHAHSPCLPAIKKIFPLDDKGERESCQMEECGECLKTVTEKFQIPEAEDSSPPQLKRHELRKAMTKSCIKKSCSI